MEIDNKGSIAYGLISAAQGLELEISNVLELLRQPHLDEFPGLLGLMIGRLSEASKASAIARRNFRYAHDCDEQKCELNDRTGLHKNE